MLSESVTSSASTRRCSERGSTSSRGLRIVATTFQSRSRKDRAISSPNPDEHPVIRMVFMWALLSGFAVVLPICCQRRPAALTWLKRNRIPPIYGTLFRLASRIVVNDKPQDRGDGQGGDLAPQGGVDRRVRADAQRNIDALLEAAKAVFGASGVDAPVREVAERAGV